MKATLLSIGLAVLALCRVSASETLTLRLEPDQRLLLTGDPREVVVKIDLKSAACERPVKRLPLNLAIVLDRSGSMTGAKLEKAKQAAMGLIDQLTARDTVSVVVYDTEAEVLSAAQPVEDREALKSKIMRVRAGSSTALYAGVEAGAEQLSKHFEDKRINRVILLSDGLANVGPSSKGEVCELGRRLARRGLSVSTIGVGDDYNEDLMAGLAEASDANYYYVRDAEKLPEIFAKELGGMLAVTAREVRIEIICPDGVEPVELIGRPEKFRGRKAVVNLGPFASAQARYLFLRCRVKAEDEKERRDLASVNVSYLDEMNGSREARSAQTVQVGFTKAAEKAQASVNTGVAAERELQLNAIEKDKAMKFADEGKSREAVATLKSNAQQLLSVAPAAPAKMREKLEQEANEQMRRADDIAASGGMSKGMRKTIQSESYRQKNAK
jgi:Ca-activated chloride channel family protein